MTRLRSAFFLCTVGLATAQDKITYQDQVRPILENRCMNCHNPDKKKGGLDLSTFAATMAGGSGGVNLEPGDPAAGQFLKVITHQAEPFMPPKSDKLPEAEIAVISKWIAGGLLETASSAAKVKKKADFAMSAGGDAGKPAGPPAMPEHLLLDPVSTPPRPNAVTAMAHSPWAPLVAIGAAKQVLLYHSQSGELLGVLPFPDGGFPEHVTFTRNGALVLASGGIAGQKGQVVVWDVKTGKRVILLGEEFESIPSADITPDYTRIAIGTREKRVKIYDTVSGQKLFELKKHTDWVTSVAFSPDGVLLASGDRNGGVMIWETPTGGEFYNLRGHEKRIATLAWRGDSNLVASGSEDGNWIWWEMVNGSQVKKQASHGGALALHFAPDGRMVSGGRDGHLRIWDTHGAQVRDWVPGGGLLLAARFTEEGKTVLTGAENGEIKIWDAAKDAAPLGNLIYNPPSIDTRIDSTKMELTAKQAELEKTTAMAGEREKAMGDAKAMVESTKKVMADAVTAAENVTKEAAAMKAEAVKLSETNPQFTAALDQLKKQLEAPASPAVPATQGMLGDIQQTLSDAAERLKTAAERLKTAAEREQQAATMKAKTDELAKSMLGLERKAGEAEKAVADAKTLFAAAAAAHAASQRTLNYWQAAKLNKNILTQREELSGLMEKIEGLKAEIPAVEAEIKSLTEKKSGTPPPSPEELPKLEKELALAITQWEEAKKELAAAEPQLPEKEKAVEGDWQKYLGSLPR